MFQMKAKDKVTEELSEVDIDNLRDKQFRIVIIKMIKELRRRIDAQSKKLEVFHKALENIKKNKYR